MRELKAYDASGSRSRHLQKIRDFIGVRRFVDTDWSWLDQVAREAASTRQELEDIINVLIEELVRQKFELPGFTQLVRAARAARNAVNTAIFKSITEQLSAEQRQIDRKSVVLGQSVSGRVDLGCRRTIKKKKT